MELISIIVPCYNEEEALPLFYAQIRKVCAAMEKEDGVGFEFLFVNDGSRDGTAAAVRRLQQTDGRVRYLGFSRNFGKEAAMYAGLRECRGDWAVIMDADLQDPPALLPDMYRALKDPAQDLDCAATRRVTRKGEPPIRSFFARMFYRLINRISKTEIVDGARDFRMMSRRMVDAILSVGEVNRFSKGIFGWVGFNTKWFEYENIERAAGETKWSFWKLFLYSLDGIVAFSTAPLAVASVAGIVLFLVAMVMIVVIIVRTLVWGDPTAGWPSLVCIICLIGGLQLLCIGILGQYLSKTYLETKKRPIYILKDND
ncbi:MAG: glycosyltransferase family 2 protein [Oscillospiraceae bacterium]|nr:glycosyltransferase family 2 protein [Oscillospiraceae bacterium]